MKLSVSAPPVAASSAASAKAAIFYFSRLGVWPSSLNANPPDAPFCTQSLHTITAVNRVLLMVGLVAKMGACSASAASATVSLASFVLEAWDERGP